MSKSKRDIIICALSGMPITDLLENWTFTITEVAPYVFKAEGRDINGHASLGAAGTAEEALDDCLKRAKKIVSYENIVSKIKDKIERVFRIKK